MWALIDEFDSIHSWEWELWEKQPEEWNAAYDEICALDKVDAPAAFAKALELTKAEYPFALTFVGYGLWSGHGVAKDTEQAAEYYSRAKRAGSWLALIHFARIRSSQGRLGDAIAALQDGVDYGHMPSYFWSAAFKWKAAGNRKTQGKVSQEVRPMLEKLLEYDHAGARWFLAKHHLRGDFGLRGLRRGWDLMRASIRQLGWNTPEEVTA